MNTKNVFLGALALICAVGSAFASLALDEPAFVIVKRIGQSTYECRNSAKMCDNAPGEPVCTITVSTSNGPKIVEAHEIETECEATLLQTGTSAGTYNPGDLQDAVNDWP